MISTPSWFRERAKSTTPRLSKTDTSARSTLSSPSSTEGCSAAEDLPLPIGLQDPLVDQHQARVALVDANPATGDQANRAGEELVLCLVQDRQDVLLAASVRKRDRLLQDDWTGVYPIVHEVDRDAPHLHAVGDLVFNGVGSRKGWQQRRMDVDHAPGEPLQETRVEKLHEPGEHDELDLALLEPGRHRAVAIATARIYRGLEHAGLDPRRLRARSSAATPRLLLATAAISMPSRPWSWSRIACRFVPDPEDEDCYAEVAHVIPPQTRPRDLPAGGLCVDDGKFLQSVLAVRVLGALERIVSR